jgi:hypothetical protein
MTCNVKEEGLIEVKDEHNSALLIQLDPSLPVEDKIAAIQSIAKYDFYVMFVHLLF